VSRLVCVTALIRHTDPERLLTAAEVAEVLAVPRSSVYEYARRQRDGLPSVRIGRHRRFIRRDVEAWIEELRGAASR
jgi:excisionase family DNA binding protein